MANAVVGPPTMTADIWPDADRLISEFERFIRRDPARRGLIAAEDLRGPLCPGHLARAASHLACSGTQVGLVTGFFIPAADPPAAETDGPPGALLLADALQAAGIETTVLTDSCCHPAVAAAAEASGWPREHVLAVDTTQQNWVESFFAGRWAARLSHLIAVERVGPAHTPASLQAQQRAGPAPLREFQALVPPEHYDRCHNMRGEIIDAATPPLHALFERLGEFCPRARSIGIGDGGNEIGMGAVPWEELVCRLASDHAGRLPCRIATDWMIIAGTSNWGAFALAAATALLRGRVEPLARWTAEAHRAVLEALVEYGPAVDGLTRRREPTVDGLPFITYIQPWEGIRRMLGLTP